MPTIRSKTLVAAVTDNAPRRRLSALQIRLRDQALALVQDESLLHGAYTFHIWPLTAPAAATLQLGDLRLHAPQLLPSAGELTAVACGVVTIGCALEERTRQLFDERRPSLALALDHLANELLFAVARIAQDRMLAQVRRQGLCMAGELHSGDPGLDIETQSLVLRLAAADDIGVTLSSGFMMNPVKSSSMVLGIGRDLPHTTWSRCDSCQSRSRCAHAQPHTDSTATTPSTIA